MTLRAWIAAAGCVLLPAKAMAQLPPQAAAHRWEVAVGPGYATGPALGRVDADLRANSATAQPYPLFTTESRFAGAWLWDARVGFLASRRMGLEARLGFSQPQLQTSVRADVEGAAPVTIVERVDQYVIDGGVVVGIDELRVGGLVPYAAAGAGYLRQLHEGLTVIAEGHVYHLGGGVKRMLLTRPRGIVRAAGLRADVRVSFLSGGITVEDRIARQFSVTMGGFLGF